jgi:hypothetical protein
MHSGTVALTEATSLRKVYNTRGGVPTAAGQTLVKPVKQFRVITQDKKLSKMNGGEFFKGLINDKSGKKPKRDSEVVEQTE